MGVRLSLPRYQLVRRRSLVLRQLAFRGKGEPLLSGQSTQLYAIAGELTAYLKSGLPEPKQHNRVCLNPNNIVKESVYRLLSKYPTGGCYLLIPWLKVISSLENSLRGGVL